MKHIKIHSFSHLLHLLYCLILALPLCAIFGRTLYVQFNKNAFESYYGETINQVQEEHIQLGDLFYGNTYFLISNSITPDNENYINDFVVSDLYINEELKVQDRIRFYVNGQNHLIMQLFNAEVRVTQNLDLSTTPVVAKFIYLGRTNNNFESYLNSILYEETYNNYSYLDNAFEYSLSRFVDDSNIGRLNLVNWFTDVFLDSSNATNMLYLNFINWYMNYALLVSCVYILFLVLMWFVSLARRLIYKGMEI